MTVPQGFKIERIPFPNKGRIEYLYKVHYKDVFLGIYTRDNPYTALSDESFFNHSREAFLRIAESIDHPPKKEETQ